jgi:hypothetical protein
MVPPRNRVMGMYTAGSINVLVRISNGAYRAVARSGIK